LQIDYDKNIQNAIKALLVSYEDAPIDIIQKYDLLFSCVLTKDQRKPIFHDRFTYYPSAGRIISSCEKHVLQLSPVQNEIFYLLAKCLRTGNHINQEVLYNFIYQNKFVQHHSQIHDRPDPKTIAVHIYKINIKLYPLKLMIRHRKDFGWSIRTESDDILPLNEVKNGFSRSKPFKLEKT